MSHWEGDLLIIPDSELPQHPPLKTMEELKVEELEKVVQGLLERVERLEGISTTIPITLTHGAEVK